MGLSRTVSEINGASVKNRKVSQLLVYLTPPLEGVLIGIL